MKTFITMIIAASGLMSISCKKKSGDLPTQQNTNRTASAAKYMPLKVGAYWIYQRGNMDTLENITYSNVYDSVYVSGDTLINGTKHFILKHSNSSFNCYYNFFSSVNEVYYAEAAQYLIPNRITAYQIGDTIRSQTFPWGQTSYEIPNYFQNMNTVLGVQNGLWFETHCTYPPGSPDYFHRYFGYEAYVENVGLQRFVMLFSTGPLNRMCHDLVRYGGLN